MIVEDWILPELSVMMERGPAVVKEIEPPLTPAALKVKSPMPLPSVAMAGGVEEVPVILMAIDPPAPSGVEPTTVLPLALKGSLKAVLKLIAAPVRLKLPPLPVTTFGVIAMALAKVIVPAELIIQLLLPRIVPLAPTVMMLPAVLLVKLNVSILTPGRGLA